MSRGKWLVAFVAVAVFSFATSSAEAQRRFFFPRPVEDPGVVGKTFNVRVFNLDLEAMVEEEWVFDEDGTLTTGTGIGTYEDTLFESSFFGGSSWTAELVLEDESTESYEGISRRGRFIFGIGTNSAEEQLIVVGFKQREDDGDDDDDGDDGGDDGDDDDDGDDGGDDGDDGGDDGDDGGDGGDDGGDGGDDGGDGGDDGGDGGDELPE